MEKPQGTSFIPKSPVKGTVKPRGVRKVYILTYVTYVLFFGTLISYKGSGKSLKNVFTRPVQSCVDAFGSMTSRVTSQGFACTRQHKLENRAPS